MERGEPAGAALRQLRARVPLGLLYGTYCPPDIRVAQGDNRDSLDIKQVHVQGVALSAGLAENGSATRTLPPLPDEPYRSLAYYDREDRALFAGRESDVERFATYLDDASTRILMLHGESGVGKSSFLHAGVIPYLEEECLGYRFIRQRRTGESTGGRGSVIFIRATNDLFGQLAQALCEFCQEAYEYETPLGEQVSADLPGVFGGLIGEAAQQRTVRAKLLGDPSLLGRIMSAISDQLPFAPILVIDQGEEVFTLAKTVGDQQRGRQALDMVRRLVHASGNFKVIFALRTEYFGRMIDRLRRGLHDTASIREYLLTDFDEKNLLEAIRRPTASGVIDYTSDTPFEKYGFRYADGVAEEIANRVVRYTTQRRDSVLPLMQVICAQLYRTVLDRPNKTIRLADLEQLGGIEGGMRSHVDGLIDELLKQHSTDKRPLQALFTQLFLRQPDGTLTTALLPEEEVQKRWHGRMPLSELLQASREMRLLKVNTLRIGQEEERRYVSLGHDALAKIAADWDEELSRGARFRKVAFAFAGVVSVAIIMAVLAGWGWSAKNEASRQGAIAEEQRKSADDQKKVAQIEKERALNSLAQNHLEIAHRAIKDGDLGRALILYLAAYERLPPDSPLRDRILQLIGTWSHAHGNPIWNRGRIREVAFSPNGEIVVVSSDSTARLWNTTTLLPFGDPLINGRSVSAVAFSLDGKMVVTVKSRRIVQLWDAESGKTVGEALAPLQDKQGSIQAVRFSPGGVTALIRSRTGWQTWNARSGSPQGEPITYKGSPSAAMALSPDGKMLVTGKYNGEARLWNVTTAKPQGEPIDNGVPVSGVACSSDGNTVITGGKDGSVRSWDPRSGDLRWVKTQHRGEVSTVAISSDGQIAITGSESNNETAARLWDAHTGTPIGDPLVLDDEMRVGTIPSMVVAFSPDGSILAGSRYQTRLFAARKGRPRAKTLFINGGVLTIAFSPDGKLVLMGGADGMYHEALVWNVETGVEKRLTHNRDVHAVAFSQDGKTLITATSQAIQRWDSSGRPLGEPVASEYGKNINAVALNSHGTMMVAADRVGRLGLLDAATGQLQKKLNPGAGMLFPNALAFSPDGATLLTGSSSKAQLWDVQSGEPRGKPLRHFGSVKAVAFRSDGKTLLTGSDDGRAWLWDAENGQQLGEPLRHDESVTAVAFSPDGKTVITGCYDGKAQMWDVRTGHRCGERMRHRSEITMVAFSPDGKSVVTGTKQGNVRWWDRKPPAKAEPERLRMSIEWRTGLRQDENGVIQKIKRLDLLKIKAKLDALGGPCDARNW